MFNTDPLYSFPLGHIQQHGTVIWNLLVVVVSSRTDLQDDDDVDVKSLAALGVVERKSRCRRRFLFKTVAERKTRRRRRS